MILGAVFHVKHGAGGTPPQAQASRTRSSGEGCFT
jgi:hypothetical protein